METSNAFYILTIILLFIIGTITTVILLIYMWLKEADSNIDGETHTRVKWKRVKKDGVIYIIPEDYDNWINQNTQEENP